MSRTYANCRLAVSALAALLSTPLGGAAQASEDGQWTMPGKDYASTRYSGLDEINADECQGAAPRLDVLHRRPRLATKGSRSW